MLGCLLLAAVIILMIRNNELINEDEDEDNAEDAPTAMLNFHDTSIQHGPCEMMIHVLVGVYLIQPTSSMY